MTIPPTGMTEDRPISIWLLEPFSPQDRVRIALVAAHMAFRHWQRAFPELSAQEPLRLGLQCVEAFCSGRPVIDAKDVGTAAYRAVSGCELPPGNIYRTAGFSVAHLAMAPWFFGSNQLDKVCHAAMVAINYSESIHDWANQTQELHDALRLRAKEVVV